MAGQADCNIDETVVVSVNWGTVEKSDLVDPIPKSVSDLEAPVLAAATSSSPAPAYPASPGCPGKPTDQKVQCSPFVDGVKAGFDWKATGNYDGGEGRLKPSCLLQEEITVICHQGVMEKNSYALAGAALGVGSGVDREEKVDGPPESGKKDLEMGQRSEPISVSSRTAKIGKWDVAVERKRLVNKEARDNGVQYAKTWHSEVAKCTRPGLAGDDPLALLERQYQMQTLDAGNETGRSESLVERVETLKGRAVVASNEVGTWMLVHATQLSGSRLDNTSGKKEGLPFLRKMFSTPDNQEEVIVESTHSTTQSFNQSF